MQKFLISTAIVVAMAGPSIAGGLAEPMIEPEPMVIAEPVGSLGGYGAAAAILGGAALIAILAASDDDDNDTDNTNGTSGTQ